MRLSGSYSMPMSQTRRTAAALLLSSLLVALATRASDTPTRIEYEGTLLYEGHARFPGDVRPYRSRQVFSTNARGDARVDWTTWKDGDSLIVPETYLVTNGHAFHRSAPDAPWEEYVGARARDARLQASAGLPALIETITAAGPGQHEEKSRKGRRLDRYTRLQPHPRLGDVRDSVAYGWSGDDPVPQLLLMALYERDANWRLSARRTAWSSSPVDDSVFAAPAAFTPARADADRDSLAAVPPLVSIAPGVWSADLADIDSRTLIVEFADHLAVIELAVGSANGERIVDAARRRWPKKPIRYAFFSHYHPHYAGGLRALIAEGATIVTTPGNAAFVARVARYPFHARPDRLELHPRPVKVVTFTGRYELADKSNRIVAYDYGARSQHTDEFAVFWLPKQKLLFESEQGWVTVDGATRASRRAKALLEWIAEKRLDVDRLVQGWPMRDTDRVITRAHLDSLVQATR